MGSRQQKVIFCSVYLSYVLYVYVKRSVTSAMPDIANSENLDKNQMGLILSSQMLSYAASKFACGILMDFISPKLALSAGLITSALTVILFASVQSSVVILTALWFLNGLTCGPGWPAAAFVLKKWFRKDQFGTVWSTLSTSMNLAGTFGPLITAYIITYSGWRTSLLIPGTLALLCGIAVWFVVQDKPQTPVDNGQDHGTKNNLKETEMGERVSRLGMFKLPAYAGVCVTYGIISLVQYGTLQWAPLYIVNDMGHSIITGNSFISSLEVGGIIGSLLAGYYSDHLLSKHPSETNYNIRQYVIAWFTTGLVIFLYLLTYRVNPNSHMIWINIVGFGLGLTLYGPISIFGVVAIECAPSHMSGSAHAIASLFANVGQMAAGLPLGYIAKMWGWQTTFLLQLLLVTQMAAYLFFYTSYVKNQSSNDKKKIN